MTDANESGKESGQLRWLVGLIFDRDKDVGLYIAAALTVLFAAIMAIQTGVSADGLQAFMWLIGKVMIAAAILIFAFHALRSSPIVRIVANVAVVVASLYALIGVAQVLMADRFHPPVARAACLANPFQPGCALSAEYGNAALAQADTSDVTAATGRDPIVGQVTRITAEGVTVSEPLILEAPAFVPPEGNGVFIHFAGAINRQDIVATAATLVDAGWTVPWADNGGERLTVAVGLNEIRYFNADDAQAAEELARQFAEAADWVSLETLKLRDLSGAGLSPKFEHQFEIWTSDGT